MPRRSFRSNHEFNAAAAADGFPHTMTAAEYSNGASYRRLSAGLCAHRIRRRETAEAEAGTRLWENTDAGRQAATRAREREEYKVKHNTAHCALSARSNIHAPPFAFPPSFF
jgi:hypothetical protein